ncbi:PKD domain-containing protein [Chitinophaga sp. XS-30]|uniref:PKD domain-containing protein n=1 Tax=Chitinophaga sp. XS-30 TaxID=2604421 RepID=UPI0011DC80DA|nr:PKD domain-containing protein [Chitinophaga sp. XS-30]QEH43654.1 PKD domain-containing protein [Chitinophaga sp. XS-30]
MNHHLLRSLKWLFTMTISLVLAAPGNTAFAQTVGFTADRTEGCAPLTVSFTNTSDAGGTAYDWNFGLGANATTRDADKIFTVPGTYNVVLTVTYPSGPRSVTHTVTVHANPVAAFSVTPQQGCTPLNVQFTDQSTPGSGTITSVVWDFGDGITSSQPNPAHTYTIGGSFSISTIVTNSHGCTNGLTQPNLINVGQTPNIDFTSDVASSCVTPLTVNFMSSGPGGLTYSWDFGDPSSGVANTSTIQHPTHVYQQEGRYTVTLTARDAQGCEAVVTKQSYVTIETTRADFEPLQPPCSGTNVLLENTTMPRPTLSTWTLPDGSTSFATDLLYYFPAPGDYTFTLTSGLPGCMETITKTITVHESPEVDFIATPPAGCAVPFTTQFSAQTTNATAWQWTFGDGTTGNTANPSHTYNNFGEYDVTLTASNSFGCEATVTRPDYIRIAQPRMQLWASEEEGCIPLNTNFGATMLAGGPIVSYSWDLGDGTTSTAPSPAHTYTTQGVFTVRLTAVVAGGCQVTAQMNVRAGEIPVVEFDANPKAPCASDPVTFTNLSTPPGTEWEWSLPRDGAVLTQENPTHIFQQTGLHDVFLTVSNYGCRRTLYKPDFITIYPPIARFTTTPDCVNRLNVQFNDASDFGPDPTTFRSWRWDFGDGNTSTEQSPLHTYASTGEYQVRLFVSNGSCDHEVMMNVSVIDERPVISVDDDEICAGEAVTFSRTGMNEANMVYWQWTWGDGFYAPEGGANISKRYDQPGNYTVIFSGRDRLNCPVNANTLNIQVNGITANFSFSGRNCDGDDIAFTDQSVSANGYSVTEWAWNFGDGTPVESPLTRPVDYEHAFAQPGTYNVRLLVRDDAGCEAAITRPVPVTGVTAEFQAAPVACMNQPTLIRNNATGSNLTYAWDFGNGATGTAPNPQPVYTQPGEYTVSLTVTNDIGCTETIVKNDYIRVPDPQARFTIPADLPVCPPILVQFTNTSSGHERSVWDFGDGSRSDLAAPSHVYNLPGTFAVTLNVYSEGDCVSTATGEVVIKGPIGTRTMLPRIGCLPHDVTLNAVSNNAVRYIWDMDNGTVRTTTTNSFTYKYEQAGVYYPRVVLEDDQGCRVPAQGPEDSIIVDEVRADFTIDASQACDFGYVFFTNNSTSMSNTRHDEPNTYQWDFGYDSRTDDVSSEASPAFLYSGVGTYQARLIVTSVHGCVDEVTQEVTVEPRPESAIAPVMPVCLGEPLRITGSEGKNLPGTGWQWLVDNVVNNATGTSLQLNFTEPGTHDIQLVIRNPNGTCPDTAQTTANINPLPVLNVTPEESVLCLGDDLQLLSNGSPAQFTWTNYNISDATAANPVVSPATDTTYHVQAINQFGCIRSDSARVTVSLPFEVSAADAVICDGRQTQLHANGAVRYQWIPAAGLSRADIASPMASPSTTTSYRVVGYGNDACFTDTADVLLTVHPSPELDPGPARVVPTGTELLLNVSGSPDIVQWQWYPDMWLSCADCPAPIATPRENVTYNITATNQYGCTSIALLPVKLVCEGSNIFIPNSFSPNGDGQNDIFYIRGRGVRNIKSFKIFNRWGQLVFERINCNADDASCAWDGRFNGQLLAPDVYVYTAEMTCDNNEPMLMKGNVTLLR